MEYIRVTKENLEKEHICCAITNNKDVQVSSKKRGLQIGLMKGLFFLKARSEASVLLNIYLRKMHGYQLRQMDICILIVCGCQERLKGMATLQIC